MLILGISETFISIGIWLLTGLYSIVSSAFRLFLVLAEGKIADTSSFSTFMNNVYVIIGVVMLFVLAFALLRGMVNTEDKKQGTSTIKKVVINLVTSLIMVVLLPTIFDFAYDFQDSFLHYNVIGKLFGYGITDVESDNSTVSVGANRMANGVFTAFFYPNCNDNEDIIACQDDLVGDSGRNYNEIVAEVDKTGRFGYYIEFSKLADEKKIDFQFLLSLIAGMVLIYVAVSFCFDMALRLVKLYFYQLIAPMPIFLRVIPEGKLSGTFNNWLKVTLTCYLEVFIRILVFYFCIYIFSAIFNAHLLELQLSGFLLSLAKAFIIMGIVLFMKQAPKLFSEVTGLDSGNMKLGIKDKLKDGGFFMAGAALGAGATTMVRNATNAFMNNRNKYARDSSGKIIKVAGKRLLKNGQTEGFGGRLWSVATGVTSTFSGGVSGTVRGGKAGLSAKNFGEMKNAAGKGTQAAVDARTKRANYKAAHSAGGPWYNNLTRTTLGHIQDMNVGLRGWAGIKNIADLKSENSAMDSITKSRDSFDSITDNLILKEMGKGKTTIDTGSRIVDFSQIINTQQMLNEAKVQGSYHDTATGITYTLAQVETMYNNALRNARFQIQDDMMESDSKFAEHTADVRAKMAAVRAAGVEYKGKIRNNANLSALSDAGIYGALFSNNADYRLSKIIVDDFDYGNVSYKDIDFDPLTNKLSYRDGNNGRYYTINLDPQKSTRDAKLLKIINGNLRYDNNDQIDSMEKGIKRNTGENNIQIVARSQQNPNEDKK